MPELKAGDNLEFYTDKKGEYRWRLTARNGEVVGAANEGFSSEASAKNNFERDKSNDKVELYTDKAGEYRWRGIAKNGQNTGSTTEGYSSKASCLNNIERNGYNKENIVNA